MQSVRAALVLIAPRKAAVSLVAALLFVAAALLPFYRLRLLAVARRLDRDVHGAGDVVDAVLRPDQLHLARDRGVLRHRHVHRRRRPATICRFRCWSWSPGLPARCSPLIVGLATLRISGVYFVIFTLGLAELVRQIVAWAQHVMGTSSGLYVLITMSDQTLYWLLLGLAAMVYPDRLVHRPLAARLCAAHHRQRRGGGGPWRDQHRARQGGPVRDLEHLRRRSPARWWRRAGAMSSRRSPSARSCLRGRHHGAARRRPSAVGTAAGRHSVHAAVGVHLREVSRRRPRCCSASASCSSSISFRAAWSG